MLVGCATAPAPTPSSAEPEEDPLEARLEWLTEVLSSGEVTEPQYAATFTSDFIDNVAFEDFRAVVIQIGAGAGDWQVEDFESRDGLAATVLLSSAQTDSVRANITLENVVPHRISGLLLQPAEPPELDDPPADIEGAAERLAEIGELTLGVFEVDGDVCAPIAEHGGAGPAPIGSAFKLYVLEAVAQAVDAGQLSWDDDVSIEEANRSIPTGVMQDSEVGETFSLREMAEAMIAFSDNTAADHLINLAGRGAVEGVIADFQAQPELNIPLLDTMDLAALKVGPASGLAEQWVSADEARRRQILDQVSDIAPADIPLGEFDQPVLVDQVEWFASPLEMCEVLDHLYDRGEPLTQILTINPGLPGDYDTIAFKGGSEPGLVAMSWLIESGGRRYVVAGSVVNPEEAFDQLEPTLLFGAIRDLVGASS